jgi:hypothetical protein
MAVVMTPEELRDYIRFMPDDEVLRITIEYTDGNRKEDSDGGEQRKDRSETV